MNLITSFLKDKLQDINNIQLKLEVHDTYKKMKKQQNLKLLLLKML